MAETESILRGKLVRLAAPRPEDAVQFAAWSEDAEYLRLVDTDYARPVSVEEFAERDKERRNDPNGLEFRIRTLQDDELIGFVALHSIEWNNQAGMLSMGIGGSAYWNKGYGTDALRLILRYAFTELNLYRVGLEVIAYNPRAIRAYEKAGFQREGAARGAVLRDGLRCDHIFMGILRDEWREEG